MTGVDYGVFKPTPPRIADGRATPHGIAAALKAEAPQGQPTRGFIADGGAASACLTDVALAFIASGDAQRAARKVRNATKRRRGWR